MEKKKAKPFQIVMVAIFVGLIILAVVVFSNTDRKAGPSSDGKVNYGSVVVWGTVPATSAVKDVFDWFNRENQETMSVTYVAVQPDALEQKLLEALSNDKGPDAIILPHEWLHKNTLRIAPIPYDPTKGGVSVRDFKDTFAQAGEIFLYPGGTMALPLAIDPLVMYWNRDLFSNAEIALPPTSWKDLLSLTEKLTQKKNLNILQSTIALGEYDNVDRAKDILALMFLQVGSSITELGPTGALKSAFGQDLAVRQAVRYYVDFANPLKNSYSWNRSLPDSQDAFLAGDLALYLDFASAYDTLSAKNQRLNFDLAPVPQTDGQETTITYGKIHGITVMKRGKNPQGAMVFSRLFTAKDPAGRFATAAGMAPMRRDLLSVPQADAFQAVLYSAALRARAWIDPQPIETDAVFSRMIESILSGKSDVDNAVGQADTETASIIDPS